MKTAVAVLVGLQVTACASVHEATHSHSSPRPSGAVQGATATAAPTPAGEFGRLPAPVLRVPSDGEPVVPPDALQPYFGPAHLTWSGQLPALPAAAPVYTYSEPTTTEADAFAASLGAQAMGEPPEPPIVASYQSQTFSLSVLRSQGDLEEEPRYVLTPPGSEFGGQPPDDATARTTAASFLSTHRLLPTWSNHVLVDRVRAPALVVYNRQFAVAPDMIATQVNAQGDATGIEVTVSGNSVFQVTGPVPLPLRSAAYPLLTPAQAVKLALASGPITNSRPIIPTPTVTLTQVRLVYLVVSGGGRGFFEPALLFTGTFRAVGRAFEKRVLVPAVAPADLRG